MRRDQIIDAEFEVVDAPRRRPVVYGRAQRAGGDDPLAPLRWVYGAILAITAVMTLLVGLSGGDLDTRPEEPARTASPSPGDIQMQPVQSFR